MVNGNLATVEELMKPFVGRGAEHSGTTQTSGALSARRSSQSGFWWHGADYVESSRGACCANHFTSLPGRRVFTCSSVADG
jgi:hypothetical protein